MKSSYRVTGEMSERQAERIIETYENAKKNGDEWAHDVFLRRGTEKYQSMIDLLNNAFRVKSIDLTVQALEGSERRPGKRHRP